MPKPIMHEIKLCSLKGELEVVIDTIRNAQGNVNMGKVQAVFKHISQLVEYHASKGKQKIKILEKLKCHQTDTWLAVTEAHRIAFTYRWLKQENFNSDYFLCVRSGIFPPIDDDKVLEQKKQYNREFQYYTAAILQQSSFEITNIEQEGQQCVDDVTARYQDQNVAVECKRIYSEKNLEDSTKTAERQLIGTIGDYYKIIIIDISPIMYKKSLRTKTWKVGEIQEYIEKRVPKIASKVQSVISSPAIQLVILETLIPYAQKKNAPCAYKFRYFAPMHTYIQSDQILQKIYECKE